MEDSVVCKIDGIVYSDRNTGFFILKVSLDDGSHTTVKGSFPGISIDVGFKAEFRGKWIDHPTYGKQLQSNFCEIIPEKNKSGIVKYLISNVKSIGPITAGKLYNEFGDKLLEVLNDSPEKIAELEFLTKTQAKSIINEWKQSSIARFTSIFLMDLRLDSNQIKSVYSRFGSSTVEIIKKNPYQLFECSGIGFQTADVAARKLGIGCDDIRRVQSMIIFIMQELSFSEGHVYATSDQIKSYAKRMFKKFNLEPFSHGEYISDSAFFSALTHLKDSEKLVSDNGKIYLYIHWYHETASAQQISRMLALGVPEIRNLKESLTNFEQSRGLTLSNNQRLAFMLLNKSRVCVISGYPGTGKTLLISAFVHLFEFNNLHYSLLSPTGIAAKRLSQVTGRPASTIHRALGYKPDGTWEFYSDNKFRVDAVIVDETSMVDCSTFFHLISALPDDTILILVGDSAQLPSVGAGFVLNNLINSQHVSHVALTEIYRQEKQSDIVIVAHSILSEKPVDTSFKNNSEFVFLPFSKENILDEICKLTVLMKKKKSNFQVIAPMYDGELGVNNLNRRLREVLNSGYTSNRVSRLKFGTSDLYEGDRVMVIKNDYDRMVFNGDVGKVQRVSIKKNEVIVKVFDWFDHESPTPRYLDKVFSFTIDEAKSVLRVAYACTTHKVQGQEFDYIIMPMTMAYGIMLYRNLVYTAITRAKKKVFIFGDQRAFHHAISNNRETIRNSALSSMIDGYCLLLDQNDSKLNTVAV